MKDIFVHNNYSYSEKCDNHFCKMGSYLNSFNQYPKIFSYGLHETDPILVNLIEIQRVVNPA